MHTAHSLASMPVSPGGSAVDTTRDLHAPPAGDTGLTAALVVRLASAPVSPGSSALDTTRDLQAPLAGDTDSSAQAVRPIEVF